LSRSSEDRSRLVPVKPDAADAAKIPALGIGLITSIRVFQLEVGKAGAVEVGVEGDGIPVSAASCRVRNRIPGAAFVRRDHNDGHGFAGLVAEPEISQVIGVGSNRSISMVARANVPRIDLTLRAMVFSFSAPLDGAVVWVAGDPTRLA